MTTPQIATTPYKITVGDLWNIGSLLLGQIAAIGAWIGLMLVLTSKYWLAIPYGIFLGLGVATALSLVFTKSATASRAVELILKTPGGYLLIGSVFIVAVFIWRVQPVLHVNGFSWFTAILATVLSQVPLAIRAPALTRQFIAQVFEQDWYVQVDDAMMREIYGRRLLDRVDIIEKSMMSARDAVKGRPYEADVTAVTSQVDLSVANFRRTVRMVCQSMPQYMPPAYQAAYTQLLQRLEAQLDQLDAPALTQTQSTGLTLLGEGLNDIDALHLKVGQQGK